MNHHGLRWNAHCVANVGLIRKRLSLYKRGFKIYDLLVFFSSSFSPDADLTRPILNRAIFNVYSPNVVEP